MRAAYGRVVKARTELLFYSFTLLFVFLAVWLFRLQVLHHGFYRAKAERFRLLPQTVRAERGPIYDRTGRPLAITLRVGNIILNPRLLNREEYREKRGQYAETLAKHLGMPRAELETYLRRDRGYVPVKRRVPWVQADRIRRLKIPGVTVEPELQRVYPNGRLAAHVLGFVNHEGIGVEGVEAAWDKTLRGRDGRYLYQADALRQRIPDTQSEVQAPRPGKPLTLSIDYVLQDTAERELDKAVATYRARAGWCVVMDVRTGEILVMAQSPRFDPNRPGDSPPQARLNGCIKEVYEPGSTLKTITAASGLDSGAVSLSSAWYCGGSLQIGRNRIRCVLHRPFYNGHGTVRLKEILTHSCNVGASHIGFSMGSKRLRDYLERFGFGRKTGVELDGELGSWLPPRKKWPAVTTSNVAFGQGVAVTPLQLCAAYAAIGNDGLAVQPTILKYDGKRPLRTRRVLKPETARAIQQLLQGVVDDGTGKPAKVAGYKTAGKTGSAQKADPKLGYKTRKYTGSFLGLAPADDPKVAILVAMDEPKGSHWGATTSAPVWREVARQTLARLSVPPDDPNDRVDGSDPSSRRRASSRGH